MSYRTYIYYGDEKEDQKDYKCFQILGNNEYYDEWFDEMVRQGLVSREDLENHEYCYGTKFDETGEDDDIFDDTLVCEVKDIMGFVVALEKVVLRRESERIQNNKEEPNEYNSLSFFDFNYAYENAVKSKSFLTDTLLDIISDSYAMLPLSLIKGCWDCLEPIPYKEIKDRSRFYNFRIKKGKKIFISAG